MVIKEMQTFIHWGPRSLSRSRLRILEILEEASIYLDMKGKDNHMKNKQ